MQRRALLKGLAGSAALVVVSQGLVACAADAATGATGSDTTDAGGTTTNPSTSSCVLTAALTEGPYFVDEKLERSDIRAGPAAEGAT